MGNGWINALPRLRSVADFSCYIMGRRRSGESGWRLVIFLVVYYTKHTFDLLHLPGTKFQFKTLILRVGGNLLGHYALAIVLFYI